MVAQVSYAPILFGRDAAAAYLDISPRRLEQLVAESKLIPKRLGGSRGFLRDDLEDFARALPDWSDRKPTKE